MPTMTYPQTYPSTAGEQTYIEVSGGVDTHKDTHTAAALDASGRLLGHREFAATAAGYAALLAWLGTLGQLELPRAFRTRSISVFYAASRLSSHAS